MLKKFSIRSLLGIIVLGLVFLAGCDNSQIDTPDKGGNEDVDKTTLIAAITTANTLNDATPVGTDNGTVTQTVKNTFTAAIASAQVVVDNTAATQTMVNNAVTTLNSARSTFSAAIKQPISGPTSSAAVTPANFTNATVIYSDQTGAATAEVTSLLAEWSSNIEYAETEILAGDSVLRYMATTTGTGALGSGVTGIEMAALDVSRNDRLHIDMYVVGDVDLLKIKFVSPENGAPAGYAAMLDDFVVTVKNGWFAIDIAKSSILMAPGSAGNVDWENLIQMVFITYGPASTIDEPTRFYVDNIYFYGGTPIDPDTIGPVITLNGQSPMTVALDGTYTEPGATVTDNQDIGLMADITGTVDTAVAGTYTITYTATDSDGNTTTKTRTVYVGTSANLVLNGDFASNDGSSWTTYGTAAAYNYSTGACVATITAKQSTNWAIQHYQNIALDVGTYEFSFDYSSTINSSITVSIENPGYTSFLTTGTDGKPVLTATSAVQHFSNTFTMTAAEAVSKVNFMFGLCESGAVVTIDNVVVRAVTDSEIGPVITLLGSSPMTVTQGDSYAEPGATALDNIDGNVTSSIVTTGTVNTATIGSYTITYTVTDSDENESIATRTVNVIAAIVHPTPLASPSAAALASAILVYTDTAKPAGATQANITSWGVLEGESVSTRNEVAVGGNNMLHFTMTGVMRRVVNFDSINLTGKRIHFEIYSYGNAAEPAADGGVTPNEFKLEIRSSDSARNTYQTTNSPEGSWVTVDMLVSECNFATANADLTAVTSLTFNESLGSRTPQDPSGFYIDNLYFY